jgi:Peptidase family M28
MGEMTSRAALVGIIVVGCVACRARGPGSTQPPISRNVSATSADAIRADVAFLADDALEGRGTGTRGFELAAKYLRTQLIAAGATPVVAGTDYFQHVPLLRTHVDPDATHLTIERGGASTRLLYNTDYLLFDTHRDLSGGASGRVVFVGYGVTAPELHYDDYAGLDVRGAIVAMVEFEAPPAFPATLRAYHSDFDVKRANAMRHGAVGAFFVRSKAEQERFPWTAMLREVQIGFNSLRWVGEDGRPDAIMDSLQVIGDLNAFAAETLFKGEAHELPDILTSIDKGNPPKFALSKRITVAYRAQHETVNAVNIVGEFEGSDPALKNEYVVYSAHADHLGIGPVVDGDAIYNGAMDNAGGCAVLLEVARAFGRLSPRPARSVLFVFVTAEEAGLQGSDYFAHHPVVPRNRLVADINIDGGTTLASVTDLIAWGSEHSSLGSVAERVAKQTGWTLSPDPFPEQGFFVRSDQYSFVKAGIPSLYVDFGFQSAKPGVDVKAIVNKWMVTKYHSPKDDVTQPIQYPDSARLAGFLFGVGDAVAMDPQRPRWNDNDFFESRFASAP